MWNSEIDRNMWHLKSKTLIVLNALKIDGFFFNVRCSVSVVFVTVIMSLLSSDILMEYVICVMDQKS